MFRRTGRPHHSQSLPRQISTQDPCIPGTDPSSPPEASVDRLASKVIVETRHNNALSISHRYAEFFPVLFHRIAFPLDRLMLQDSLCEPLTITLGPDPCLSCYAESERVFENHYGV